MALLHAIGCGRAEIDALHPSPAVDVELLPATARIPIDTDFEFEAHLLRPSGGVSFQWSIDPPAASFFAYRSRAVVRFDRVGHHRIQVIVETTTQRLVRTSSITAFFGTRGGISLDPLDPEQVYVFGRVKDGVQGVAHPSDLSLVAPGIAQAWFGTGINPTSRRVGYNFEYNAYEMVCDQCEARVDDPAEPSGLEERPDVRRETVCEDDVAMIWYGLDGTMLSFCPGREQFCDEAGTCRALGESGTIYAYTGAWVLIGPTRSVLSDERVRLLEFASGREIPVDLSAGYFIAARTRPDGFWVATQPPQAQLWHVNLDGSASLVGEYAPRRGENYGHFVLDGAGNLYEILGSVVRRTLGGEVEIVDVGQDTSWLTMERLVTGP